MKHQNDKKAYCIKTGAFIAAAVISASVLFMGCSRGSGNDAATVTVTPKATETAVMSPQATDGDTEIADDDGTRPHLPDDIGSPKDFLDTSEEKNPSGSMTDMPPQAEEQSEEEVQKGFFKQDFIIKAAGAAALLLLIAAAAAIYLRKRNKPEAISYSNSTEVRQNEYVKTTASSLHVGSAHNIGKRPQQQDSLGVTNVKCGLLAAVADGMGGLSDGDKVSQKTIISMLESGEGVAKFTAENPLFKMVKDASNAVNSMLGIGGPVVSGSTLIAVLVSGGYFHWVSVGDSRIYLYRGGSLIQLNREHNYEADLIVDAINGNIPFAEVKTHPKRQGLTSFIGMGELKHVDGSIRPIKLCGGDKLLLMSDGVYNNISQKDMEQILSRSSAREAADAIEKTVLSRNNPKQDNFTVICIDTESSLSEK